MNPQDIVIGAGPAGITAALKLAEKGHKVLLLEKNGSVGGLCQSLQLWDQQVDLGPHRFFSNNKQVVELWRSMAPNYLKVNRITRISYKNKFFQYPLKAMDTLMKLGILEATSCILSYGFTLCKKQDESNFEGWVKNRFGERLFNTFFKEYSEKLWGLKCSEIHSDFAAQRIKNFSLLEAIKKALGSKTTHKTAIDEFAYPRYGTGEVYKNMELRFKQLGGEIIFNTSVTTIDPTNNTVHTAEGKEYLYRSIISTMPLTTMVVKIPTVTSEVLDACKRLKYRNTILVYLLANESPFPDNWVYVHSPEVRVGRITNFSNWGSERQQTILCLEYWCSNKDPEWKLTDNEWQNIARHEINLLDLQCGSLLDHKVIRIPKSYPIYDIDYKANMAPVRGFLEQYKNLHAIGRYGSFRYNNQDHSILMGLLAAENITEGANHNLWDVNEDKNYQEDHKSEI